MTALLDALRAVPWSVTGMVLCALGGLALGLAQGAAIRTTLYAAFRDPFTDKVSTVTVMVVGSWLAIVFAFYRAAQVKPDLIDSTMMTLAGATLLLTGSAAGTKWLASKSGVRVDESSSTTTTSVTTERSVIPPKTPDTGGPRP